MAAMALAFVSVICLMSALAKNIKEAGGYIAPIYILVMMVSMGSMFTGDGGVWMYLLPVYGNIVNIKDILTYDYSHANGLFSIAAATALAGAMAYFMVRTFYSERMMKS
jgi:sodium transport system permease protein